MKGDRDKVTKKHLEKLITSRKNEETKEKIKKNRINREIKKQRDKDTKR